MKRIAYIQYTNPAAYPPLEHSSRILADAGWEVLFVGTGSLGADSLAFPPHDRITVRRWSFHQPGAGQKVHYVAFCVWSIAWAVLWRASWVYASDLLSCPPASVLAGVFRKHLIYHEHDSPESRSQSWFLRACLRCRRWCAHFADVCVLPNAVRARQFVSQTGASCPVEVVWNAPSRTEVLDARLPSGQGLRLLYHGSIVPERLPVTVVEALTSLPRTVTLTIAGYETAGSQGYVDRLLTHAADLGVGDRVDAVGTVPTRGELLRQSSAYDVGLALLPTIPHDINLLGMTGASNKAFDYLACGLSVLVSDLPDWRQMFVEPGYGLACDPSDPASIAAAIRHLYEHPDAMRAMGERGRQKILEEWNYEMQFARLELC